jgi:propanol-preferring alcohol dehydrogenase
MRALQLTSWGSPPELREVPLPEPGPGQVLVKIAGAGACHSDLHLMEWPEGVVPFTLPFTLGHENAGWIAGMGPGVTGWREGEPVAVYGPWGCGACRPCRRSEENYCERAPDLPGAGGGLGLDGGMADYLLVPSARLLLPLGDLDPVEAAPLGDAALTPYHAIARSRERLVPGTTVVLIGIGGLGHMGVQIARALTPSRVVAVDVDPAKLQLAAEVGADHTLLADDEAVAQVRALTGDLGAELVVDFVGTDATMAQAAAMVRVRGEVTVVGLGMGTLGFNALALPWEAAVQSTYWGSLLELSEVLALAAAGRVRAHVERFSLDEAATAYERLRAGSIEGRAVVVP